MSKAFRVLGLAPNLCRSASTQKGCCALGSIHKVIQHLRTGAKEQKRVYKKV